MGGGWCGCRVYFVMGWVEGCGMLVEGCEMLVGGGDMIGRALSSDVAACTGNNARSVASTHMNDVSSRAHTIFSIKFSQTIVEEMGDGVARETKKVSNINLVDLAGRRPSRSSGQVSQIKTLYLHPSNPPHTCY